MLQTVAQVLWVAVEKSLLLNEVNEHQPVQHDRDVPIFITGIADSLNELLKLVALLLKAIVESPGGSLNIEAGPGPPHNIHQGNVVLQLKRYFQVFKLLDQAFTGLVFGLVAMVQPAQRLAGFTTHPLP